jgi:hypothetical protein
MTVYAVISPGENQPLKQAVHRVYDGHFFEIAPGQFVVSAAGLTAQGVSQQLGVSSDPGAVTNVVVFTVAGYWGNHRKDLWEWLSVNSG